MIKKTAQFFIVLSVLTFAVLQCFGARSLAWSQLFISVLLLANFLGIVFISYYMAGMKSAGVAVILALIKYPLIGASIFLAARQPWMNPLGIVIGICEFLLIIVVTVLFKKKIIQD